MLPWSHGACCSRQPVALAALIALLVCLLEIGKSVAQPEVGDLALVRPQPPPLGSLAVGNSSTGRLQAVEACSGEALRPRSVCLRLLFAQEEKPEVARISCKIFAHDPGRTNPPAWHDFIGEVQQTCNTSRPFKYIVESEDLEPDSVYDAFCIDWAEDLIPVLQVVPTCKKQEYCGAVVATGNANGENVHEVFGMVDFLCVLLLMAYVGWSFLFEKIRILHETGAAVLFGLVAGWFLQAVFGRTASFSYDMFSYILLPMVIFAAGFNLQKRNFFRYSGYILALGCTGTVLIFVLIYVSSDLFEIRPDDGQPPFRMSGQHRLIMASVLASTDSVAPMAFLPGNDFPQLYAVVFGEGVLNDVVSILLSAAVVGETSMPPLWRVSLNVLKFLVTSSFMGLTFGFGTSLLFRHATRLHEGAVKPCVLLLGCNYACYVLTELFEFSSIFALFVCAVLCGHYAQHCMASEARSFMAELAELMAYTAEAVVFGYFGLTAVAYISRGHSFQLDMILFYILCIIFARIAAVGIVALTIRLLKRGQSLALNVKELCVVAMAGCMRGTIAYALVLRAVPAEDDQSAAERLMVTTVLGIVLINCLVFGGLFPVVLKCLGLKPEEPLEELVSVEPTTYSFQHTAAPRNLRHGIHRCWHNLDSRWLKPYLRPQHEEGGGGLAAELRRQDGGSNSGSVAVQGHSS